MSERIDIWHEIENIVSEGYEHGIESSTTTHAIMNTIQKYMKWRNGDKESQLSQLTAERDRAVELLKRFVGPISLDDYAKLDKSVRDFLASLS